MIPGHGLHKGRAAEQAVARMFQASGYEAERRGLGKPGLPDLILSVAGHPLPLCVSVKNVNGMRISHVVLGRGSAWRAWVEAVEVAEYRVMSPGLQRVAPCLIFWATPAGGGWWMVLPRTFWAILSLHTGKDYPQHLIVEHQTDRPAWSALPLGIFLSYCAPDHLLKALSPGSIVMYEGPYPPSPW